MLKVGDILWRVYHDKRRGDPSFVQVSKVGRKWADITWLGHSHVTGRIDVETLRMDGGDHSSPGTCYRSKKDYEAKVDLQKAWEEMYRRLCHIVPKGITLERIKELSKEFGLSGGEE